MGYRSRKKNAHKTHKAQLADGIQTKKGPNILIINRGSVGQNIHELMEDLTTYFAPNVVKNIKVLKSSRIKDILEAAGPFNISHTIIFTVTPTGVYMKLSKLPKGPTLTFNVKAYSRQREVLSMHRRALQMPSLLELTPPCFLMNNIQPNDGPKQHQMVATSFLKLFSPLIPGKNTADDVKRCCLLTYDEEGNEFNLRQYLVRQNKKTPSSLVNRLINNKRLPNLKNFEDIEEAFDRDGAASESEGEEAEIPDADDKTRKISVKLREAGPRLTITLTKIESGLLGGEVLYHSDRKLTAAESKAIKAARELKKKEKLARKKEQEANVERKKLAKEAHKERCLQGMSEEVQERVRNKQKQQEEEEEEEEDKRSDEEEENESDDDAMYYKDAVGEEPEEGTFTERQKRRRDKDTDEIDAKKRKLEMTERQKKEEKRQKIKEKFKKMDEKRKSKKPRSHAKRMVRKIKGQIKAKKAQDQNKKKAAEAEKLAPKNTNKTKNNKK